VEAQLSLYLALGLGGVNCQVHDTVTVTPEIRAPYPLNVKLDGLQRNDKFIVPARNLPANRPTSSPQPSQDTDYAMRQL